MMEWLVAVRNGIVAFSALCFWISVPLIDFQFRLQRSSQEQIERRLHLQRSFIEILLDDVQKLRRDTNGDDSCFPMRRSDV